MNAIPWIQAREAKPDELIEFTAHSSRLALSQCFIVGKITCMDCHDPHLKLSETKSKINNSCFTCHGEPEIAKITNHETYDECVSCHMPSTDTRDIPHVTPTEHLD